MSKIIIDYDSYVHFLCLWRILVLKTISDGDHNFELFVYDWFPLGKSGKNRENPGKFGEIRENLGKIGKIRENQGKSGKLPGYLSGRRLVRFLPFLFHMSTNYTSKLAFIRYNRRFCYATTSVPCLFLNWFVLEMYFLFRSLIPFDRCWLSF
jgi:hypothetical protein